MTIRERLLNKISYLQGLTEGMMICQKSGVLDAARVKAVLDEVLKPHIEELKKMEAEAEGR